MISTPASESEGITPSLSWPSSPVRHQLLTTTPLREGIYAHGERGQAGIPAAIQVYTTIYGDVTDCKTQSHFGFSATSVVTVTDLHQLERIAVDGGDLFAVPVPFTLDGRRGI
jgi:hypothetical protein